MSSATENLTDLQRKKKTRFPLLRIKKLIQLNKDVGKTTSTVPVVLSKSIELFLADLLRELSNTAKSHKTTKIALSHLKEVTEETSGRYSFMRALLTQDADDIQDDKDSQ